MTTIDENIINSALEHYIHLHQHPEISFREYSTSAYIRHILEQESITYKTVGNTGTVAFIPGKNNLKTIALRADIDALPIQEDSQHPVCSLHPGIMHACGHDLHTVCLLGAARYLNTKKESLPFNVLLIFQHAEEVLPGGAQDILQDAFFQQHLPQWIIALHADPELVTGTIGTCPGHCMASGDEIYITLQGPGGHAAMPDKTVDLVLVASHLVVALQQIVSRNAPPSLPTVLTFGNIRCQSTMNIIPQEITLEGTFRTFDEQWRTEAKKRIHRIAQSLAESMGACCDIRIVKGYPSLYNDPHLTTQAFQILQAQLGDPKVFRLTPRMTTEDFARYSQKIPATFLRLGVQNRAGTGKLHSPEFYPDTSALKFGIQALCALATSSSLIFNFPSNHA